MAETHIVSFSGTVAQRWKGLNKANFPKCQKEPVSS